jgi:peptidoglycan/LPS O-acetylase OafA/YrhL
MNNTRAPAPERLHALDAVRGFALLLGIVFHACVPFIPSRVPIWPVEDSHRSVAMAVLFFSTHVFRMTVFFLIAGFFAHMSFHHRGAAAFIGDRLKRIAVPLVVGWPILFASIVVVTIWAATAANGGVLPKGHLPAWPRFPAFPLTHLWFLYVLLELYAAVLILCSLVAAIDRSGRLRGCVDRLTAAVMNSAFAPFILAAPVFTAFATDPKWLMWFGIPGPENSLVTTPMAVTGYGAAFGFGWLLHRQTNLLQAIERRWVLNLFLATGLIAASLAGVGVEPRLTPFADPATRLIAAAAYAAASWTATFAAIGLALRFFAGYSPTRRYIADASYWLYLIHLPIVMALQVVVAGLDWPWPVKFTAILAVAFPLMFASYQLLVRYSFIGVVLNGRREPRANARSLPRKGQAAYPGRAV